MVGAKGKSFVILLGISALLVEVIAASFSVYGLSKLFSGASLAVIFMAASLEIGKVVTASYLYRAWDKINILTKTYLITALVTLVLITSMGIYGFLSNAFQSSTIGFEKEASKIILVEEQIKRLADDKTSVAVDKQELMDGMKRDLDALNFADSSNYLLVNVRKRQVRDIYLPEIQKRDAQLDVINTRLDSLQTLSSDLKIQSIQTGADVGPIIWVARAFDTNVNTVVQYLIFVFIFVFDPLAVVLVIQTNKAWLDYKNEQSDDDIPPTPPSTPKKPSLFSRVFGRSPGLDVVSTEVPIPPKQVEISNEEIDVVEMVHKKVHPVKTTEPPPPIPSSG